MIAKTELRRWLEALPDDAGVAIDDGGLCLVEIDASGRQTDAYMEIGGIPDEETADEAAEPEAHPS